MVPYLVLRVGSVTFTVPGTPQPKGRPRVVVNKGRHHVFTPDSTKEYENVVAWSARAAHVRFTDEPVAVSVVFYGAARGDADNLAKSLLDGLKGIAFRDDKQVEDLHVRVIRRDATPRAEVVIRPLVGEVA